MVSLSRKTSHLGIGTTIPMCFWDSTNRQKLRTQRTHLTGHHKPHVPNLNGKRDEFVRQRHELTCLLVEVVGKWPEREFGRLRDSYTKMSLNSLYVSVCITQVKRWPSYQVRYVLETSRLLPIAIYSHGFLPQCLHYLPPRFSITTLQHKSTWLKLHCLIGKILH